MTTHKLPVIEVQDKALTYIITEQTLESLRKIDIISPEVYTHLNSLVNTKFVREDVFIKALEMTLGARLTYPITMVILKYAQKKGWRKLPAPEKHTWLNELHCQPNTRLALYIRMPFMEDQRWFVPRFRISKAKGLGTFKHGHLEQDEMEPYVTKPVNLFLLDDKSSYVVTDKDKYKPGEAMVGRYNISSNIKKGPFRLIFYYNNESQSYSSKHLWCGWLPQEASREPGKHEIRLCQLKGETWTKLASVTYDVVNFR
jgi:hypothetical protein